jgi:hypothetical protein
MPKPDPSVGVTTSSSLGLQTGSEDETVEGFVEENVRRMKCLCCREDDPTGGEDNE